MSLSNRRLWIAQAQNALALGNRITIRPTGSSMQPRIFEGDVVTLEPVGEVEIATGDIVLARVRRRRVAVLLHQALATEGGRYQVGSASGRADGWVEAGDVLGRVVGVTKQPTEPEA